MSQLQLVARFVGVHAEWANLASVLCAIFTGPLLVLVVSKCHFVDLQTLTYVVATAVRLTGDGAGVGSFEIEAAGRRSRQMDRL